MMNRPLLNFFSRGMGKGLVENYELLYKLEWKYFCALPIYNLATLKELKSSLASRLIDQLDYFLQTPKRAELDGADIELTVAALIHDVGKALAP